MKQWMRHAADFPAFEAIGPHDTVVDIGCGAGGACVAAGMAGAEVIGIDIDPKLVPHLHERMKGVPARAFRALASDCDPIPLPDGIASYVLCTEVMEHVDDPARFAAELNRIGKPGATYIVSVPDPASESLMETIVDPSYFERPNHQRVYSHGDFDGLLQSAGLDVLDRPRTPNNFYWAIWCVLRWSSSLDGKPEPNSIPPVIYKWNEVWTALKEAPGGEKVITRLDQMIPRTQVVIARKSDRVINLAQIQDRWRHLVKVAGNPAITPDPANPPESEATTQTPGRWRRFFRDGKLQLGRVDVSWSIRRAGRRVAEPVKGETRAR